MRIRTFCLALLVVTLGPSLYAASVVQTAELLASDRERSDQFGFAVAIDGDTIAVGAPFDDNANGQLAGTVYVYEFDGAGWTEVQKLTASDGGHQERFGWAVDLEGGRMVVGADLGTTGGVSTGAVYVFECDGSVWTETAKLTASDGAGGDGFGIAVALDGDTLLVGAPRDDDRGSSSGAAYVFDFNGAVWTETQKLVGSATDYADHFGAAVALDGGWAIIGVTEQGSAAPQPLPGELAGEAYAFEHDGASWVETQRLIGSDTANFDNYGRSIALQGSTALISALTGGSDRQGVVYVWEHDGTAWLESGRLTASDAGRSDYFGDGMVLVGDQVVIGAPRDDDQVGDGGAAYLFERDGSWLETAKFHADDAVSGDRLGGNGYYYRALDFDGARVVIGAPTHAHANAGSLRFAGAAYVFGYQDDGAAPVVSDVAVDPSPAPVGVPIDLGAAGSDIDTGGSVITSARYSVDGGTPVAMSAADGAFDSAEEMLTATIAAIAVPGVYEVCVVAEDAAGNVSEPNCTLLPVYDPDGGFVTGGGWIESPPGAYAADASLAGRANFGFVARYKKGANVPSGSTEFQFQTGGLNFHSASYEWLVVTGGDHTARFKGSGTVNGRVDPAGNAYRFMIWASDDAPDSFRIRIWSEDNGQELEFYDSGPAPLQGGSIVIHDGGN
jgi:hypothetical protein